MLIRILATLACLVALAGCEPTTRVTDSGVRIIQPSEVNAILVQHVDTVNALRAERGLAPVTLSARLTAAARTHARDMSVQQRAWHFGSDGTSPKDRAQRAGYAGRVLGENISESFDDEVSLFQSWLQDPVTRRVMLDPRATDVGFGWFQEPNGKLWWVQTFGGTGAPDLAPGT